MKGWSHRGYLPHFDGGSITQFITCRLADSLPQKVLAKWRMELGARPIENIDREILVLVKKFLDKGYGECYLKQPAVAEVIKDSLLKFDGERYKLIAYCLGDYSESYSSFAETDKRLVTERDFAFVQIFYGFGSKQNIE